MRLVSFLVGFLTLVSITATFADGVGTKGPDQFPQKTGEDLYQNLCQSCHMPDAGGARGAGAYPALSGNKNIISSMYLAYIIMYGRGGMPGFGGVLDDQQIANIVNYVRGNFGNAFTDPINERDVKVIRKPDHQYVDMN